MKHHSSLILVAVTNVLLMLSVIHAHEAMRSATKTLTLQEDTIILQRNAITMLEASNQRLTAALSNRVYIYDQRLLTNYVQAP